MLFRVLRRKCDTIISTIELNLLPGIAHELFLDVAAIVLPVDLVLKEGRKEGADGRRDDSAFHQRELVQGVIARPEM